MHLIRRAYYLVTILLTTTLVVAGCNSGDSSNSEVATSSVPSDSSDTINLSTILSEQEKLGIYFMREEEKLARDVYLKLYEQWNLNVFNNISNSEQSHMDAVLLLINSYGLTDPAKQTIGEFTDPELQQLYDDLMAQGLSDSLNALWVGALIEETDIQDIVEWMNQTDNTDIFLTYENLLCGSRNHLHAFVKQIEANGGSYNTQIPELEQEVNDILNTNQEQCG